MKITYRLLTIIVFSLACVAHAQEVKITWVYDGDTVKAEGGDKEVRIRLLGIDAPELSHKKGQRSQPFARKARTHLIRLVYGRVVTVKGYGTDKYGRLLGVIHKNGKNINMEMVKAGLAEVYRGKMPPGFDATVFHVAEKAARMEQKGVWSTGVVYVSPRLWKKVHGP